MLCVCVCVCVCACDDIREPCALSLRYNQALIVQTLIQRVNSQSRSHGTGSVHFIDFVSLCDCTNRQTTCVDEKAGGKTHLERDRRSLQQL
jgi:hypothetical protein